MKKLISWLLVVSMLLCGCLTFAAAEEAAVDETPIKLTAWAWDKAFNIAALEVAAEHYKKTHPNFELEIVELNKADAIQKLHTAFSSGNSSAGLPNIIPIEDYTIPAFLNSYETCFVDLTDKLDYSRFPASKQITMQRDGRKYGIPWDNGCAVLYYRLDVIESVGLTEADMQDLTFDRYLEIGELVKEKTGMYMVPYRQDGMREMKMMMNACGTWYTKEDGVTPNFEGNEALKAAIEWYVRSLKEDVAKAVTNRSEMNAEINGGTCWSTFTGVWYQPTIIAEASQAGLWRATKLPLLDGVEGATNATDGGGGAWYIIDGLDTTDAATDFMISTFGEDITVYEDLLENYSIVATYLPMADSPLYQIEDPYFGGQKVLALVAEQTALIPEVNFGMYTNEMDSIMSGGMQRILNGEDIDAVMADMQAQAESVVE